MRTRNRQIMIWLTEEEYAEPKARVARMPRSMQAYLRDAAAIALVDSNLHWEHILPSEKVFAYKLKMEAIKQQGQRTDLTPTPF